MNPLDQRALKRRPGIAALVLALGLLATALGALGERTLLVRQSQARLQAEATNAKENLEYTVQAYQDILLGFRALTHASLNLTREQFRRYFASLDLKAHHPGLLAVSYGVELNGDDLPGAEARLKAELREPDFTIRAPGGQDRHFILLFAEPREANTRSVGMDTRPLPQQASTIDITRDAGGLVVSGPMKVLQYDGPDPGLLMRMPFYQGDPRTLEERRAAFRGCITGVFRARSLLEEALGRDFLHNFDVHVADLGRPGAPQPPQTVYGEESPGTGHGIHAAAVVGGRAWRLSIVARRTWAGYPGWSVPGFILVGGTLISLLLWGLLTSLAQTGQRARLMALRMTEQLREEESRTEAMALAAPDPLAVVDAEGRFLRIYGGHEAILGRPRRELAGARAGEVLPPAAAEAFLGGVSRALADRTLQTVLFEAGESHYETRMLGMTEPQEGRDCVVASIRDITERLRAEEVARNRQKLESLGVLAGGIAHDFNNFLSAILGHVNMAQETLPPGSEALVLLRRAEASTLRAAELAHQMLAYSGRGSLKVDHLDLNRVVRDMAELLSVSISKKAVLDLDLAPELPPILADAVQIQQVVMNLVTNASDALGEGGGRIAIGTARVELAAQELETLYPGQGLAPGAFVRLRVEDTGCGMDPAILKRIFDPFFTTKATGRGLGLSALLGIVKGHAAGIRIASQPGSGTAFEILFPPSGPGSAAAQDAAAHPSARLSLVGTALVADDDPMVRSVLSGILAARGMEVVEAEDGQDAVERFRARDGRFDVVVLDITMPRMDGNEAFRLIRSLAPQVPVILVSGFTSREVAQAPLGTAPARFIQKPFRAADLETAVRQALESRPDVS